MLWEGLNNCNYSHTKLATEFSLHLKSNRTCNSIERAVLSNAPNSIEPPTVATKKLGKNLSDNLKKQQNFRNLMP